MQQPGTTPDTAVIGAGREGKGAAGAEPLAGLDGMLLADGAADELGALDAGQGGTSLPGGGLAPAAAWAAGAPALARRATSTGTAMGAAQAGAPGAAVEATARSEGQDQPGSAEGHAAGERATGENQAADKNQEQAAEERRLAETAGEQANRTLAELVAEAQSAAGSMAEAERAAAEAAMTDEEREDAGAMALLTDDERAADLSSGRVIVGLEPDGEIAGRDLPNVASSGGGVYLLQYALQADARAAYARYLRSYDGVAFAAPDQALYAADDGAAGPALIDDLATRVDSAVEQNSPDNVLGTAAAAVEERKRTVYADGDAAPTADLASIQEEGAKLAGEADARPGAGDQLIALVDTGAPWHDAVLSRSTALEDPSDVGDANGHGTAMLEAMLAENQDARVVSVKALDDSGRGTAATVYAAIEQAVAAGATIVNLSFSGYAVESNAAIAEAVADAAAAGCAVVAAAGNGGADARWFTPGNAERAFTVGAANEDGTRVESSNYGDTVDAYVVARSTSYAAARASGWLYGNNGEGWQRRLEESSIASAAAQSAQLSESKASGTDQRYASGRLLVKFTGSAATLDPAEAAEVLSENRGLLLLQFDSPDAASDACSRYAARPDVAFATADAPMAAAGTAASWHNALGDGPVADLSSIEPAGAASRGQDVPQGVIALVDSGVSPSQPVIGSLSALSGDDASAPSGHGDAMLEAILEESPDAGVLSVEALSRDGRGSTATVYAGIESAIAWGASVINLSVSGPAVSGDPALQSAVSDARAAGVEVVAAAGDMGGQAADYAPGNVAEAVTVGACDEDGNPIGSSNSGGAVDLYVKARSTDRAAATVSAWMLENGPAPAQEAAASEDRFVSGGKGDLGVAAGIFRIDNVDQTSKEVSLGLTSSTRTLSFPSACRVKFDLTGAGGGGSSSSSYYGGTGGKTTGTYDVAAGTTLYATVGGGGGYLYRTAGTAAGGYNGGGGASCAADAVDINDGSGGGGGCSMIATATGIRSNVTDAQLVLVAGGGGGGNHYSWSNNTSQHCWGAGGTGGGSTGTAGSGHWKGTNYTDRTGNQNLGSSGVGATGSYKGGGGGGGYRGGSTSTDSGKGGGGGTGYVNSGYAGYVTGSTTTGGGGAGKYNAGGDPGSIKVTILYHAVTLDGQSATSAGSATAYVTPDGLLYSDATLSSTALTAPSKTGYVFQGYYTEANGGGARVLDARMSMLAMDTAFTSTTLYACWKALPSTAAGSGSGAAAGSASGTRYFETGARLSAAGSSLDFQYMTKSDAVTAQGAQTAGDVQVLPLSLSGVYSVSASGASGGGGFGAKGAGGPGGRVSASYALEGGTSLYVGVGSGGDSAYRDSQKGVTYLASGGTVAASATDSYTLAAWGGGGRGDLGSGHWARYGGGGGATYVATDKSSSTTYQGSLRDYANDANKAALLLVAGGGGGGAIAKQSARPTAAQGAAVDSALWYEIGGSGGGGTSSAQGGTSATMAGQATYANYGGSEASGRNGYFGYGADAGSSYSTGGGGGYYGGYASNGGTAGGGGGSGYYRAGYAAGSLSVSVGGGAAAASGDGWSGPLAGSNGWASATLEAVSHTLVDGEAEETVYVDGDGRAWTDAALTQAWSAPAKEGWTFGGYWTGPGGAGERYIDRAGAIPASMKGSAGNLELHALWYRAVALDGQQATTAGTQAVYASSAGTYSLSVDSGWTGSLSVAAPGREGSSFEGFYSAPYGQGTQVVAGSGSCLEALATASGSAAYTAYARWDFAVTYKTWDGSADSELSETVTWDGANAVETSPAAAQLGLADGAAFAFAGWAASAGSLEPAYAAGERATISGSATLYPVFRRTLYYGYNPGNGGASRYSGNIPDQLYNLCSAGGAFSNATDPTLTTGLEGEGAAPNRVLYDWAASAARALPAPGLRIRAGGPGASAVQGTGGETRASP